MTRGLEARLAKIETRRGATDLTRLSDDDLRARTGAVVDRLAALSGDTGYVREWQAVQAGEPGALEAMLHKARKDAHARA